MNLSETTSLGVSSALFDNHHQYHASSNTQTDFNHWGRVHHAQGKPESHMPPFGVAWSRPSFWSGMGQSEVRDEDSLEYIMSLIKRKSLEKAAAREIEKWDALLFMRRGESKKLARPEAMESLKRLIAQQSRA
uniref:Uncharacterized protein n=1 Tax=Trieres chinensis TaxID=1514140 RepID=A0A7S1ZKB6_TRICV|mmetsp:Transcript_27234/g.55726  ORF Transcript_27234/g.55726 Transcript_27234/m.55726 type:complete len:133 (+) Transcript_27234:2-400(+)